MQIKTLFSAAILSFTIFAHSKAEADYGGCYSSPLTYTPPYGCPWEYCHDVVNNWSIRGAFLWWQANAEGLTLGEEVLIKRHCLNAGTGIYERVSKGAHYKNPKFKFDPGFRIGIAYAYPGNCWDIGFDWTYFHNRAKAKGCSRLDPSSVSGDTYLAFINYWESLAYNFPNHATGEWSFNLDMYDLEIGRACYLSSCFAFRPNFGLRCAAINQEYHVKSHAKQSGVFNSASYDYTSNVKAHNNFIGAGPRLGFDAELNMCWGLALFGKAAGSLVFGKFDRHSHEEFINADHFFYKFNKYKDNTHGDDHWASRAITDLSIGLKWEHAFDLLCRPYLVSFAISWEHHGFFNFNSFAFDSEGFESLNNTEFDFGPYANLLRGQRTHGDIFTQGVTFSAEVGF